MSPDSFITFAYGSNKRRSCAPRVMLRVLIAVPTSSIDPKPSSWVRSVRDGLAGAWSNRVWAPGNDWFCAWRTGMAPGGDSAGCGPAETSASASRDSH